MSEASREGASHALVNALPIFLIAVALAPRSKHNAPIRYMSA